MGFLGAVMKRNLRFILALGDMKVVALRGKTDSEVFANLNDKKRRESAARIANAITSYE